MSRPAATLTAMSLSIAMMGCSNTRPNACWPEPTALAGGLPSYEAPADASAPAEAETDAPEPEGRITLRQAIATALLRNPELSLYAWDVRSAEARTLQAGLLSNPSLDVEVENFGGTGDLEGFDSAEYTVALSQEFELGGKRNKRSRVASLEQTLAGLDYQATRMDVITTVRHAFTDVIAAQEKRAMADELERLAEDLLSTTEKRVLAGAAAPVETMKAGIELSVVRIARHQAEREVEARHRALAATWGSADPVFETAEYSWETLPDIPPEQVLRERVDMNPNVARSVAEIERSEAALEAEQAGRVPNLTLLGGVRQFAETDDRAFVAAVGLPLPLFERNQGGVRDAQFMLAKTRAQARAARLGVEAELAVAFQELQNAHLEATELRDSLLPAARKAFEATRDGYRQGRFGHLDVLDAQRTLFEARNQYIDALAAYHKAVADVERLTAMPLDSPTTE